MDAHVALTKILKIACSGERGAALVYDLHWRSLHNPRDRARVRRIHREELEHRECLLAMLEHLGSQPSRLRELWMTTVGWTVGALCFCTGFFLPMYGAGLLESRNVGEYLEAARLAQATAFDHWVPKLLAMAETERRHEAFFRRTCAAHWLHRVFPEWRRPPAFRRAPMETADNGLGLPQTRST